MWPFPVVSIQLLCLINHGFTPSYVRIAGMFCNFSQLYKTHVDILCMMHDVREAVELVAVVIIEQFCKSYSKRVCSPTGSL
jgi:hypothetical protein